MLKYIQHDESSGSVTLEEEAAASDVAIPLKSFWIASLHSQ
jgi:hypothetical protein